MVSSSSVSTYLDVTQAAKTTPGRGETAPTDPEFTARAASVLAAIHAGTELVTELPARTGLTTTEILPLLGWLSDSGLVDLDDTDGVLHAHVTKAARTALSSA